MVQSRFSISRYTVSHSKLMALALATAIALPVIPVPSARGDDARPPPDAANSASPWDVMRDGVLSAFDSSLDAMLSAVTWISSLAQTGERSDTEEIRSLINLPEKDFREFESLIRAAGFELEGFNFGMGANPNLELRFGFVRQPSDKEKAELRERIGGNRDALGAVRRAVISALLDVLRYVDAVPASGYRLSGVSMRVALPPEVKVNFQRTRS